MSTDIRVLSQNIEKIDKWPSNFHHCLSVLNSLCWINFSSEHGYTESQYLHQYSPLFSQPQHPQFPSSHWPDVVHVFLPHRHLPLPTLRNYHIARGHPIHPAGASLIRTWAVRFPDETISPSCRRQTAVSYQRPQCPAMYVHVVQEAGAPFMSSL